MDGPTVTVTEALKSGYTFVSATCTVNGKSVTTTSVNQTGSNPGVSFTGQPDVPMACTFTNKQPTPASLTLVKQVDDPNNNVVAGADVSSVVRDHEGRLVVRVFETTGAPGTVVIEGRCGRVVDLRGRDLGPFDGSLALGPWEIATLRLDGPG